MSVQNQPLQQQRQQSPCAGSGDRLEELPGSGAQHQIHALDDQHDQKPDAARPAEDPQQESGKHAASTDEILFEAACGSHRHVAKTNCDEQDPKREDQGEQVCRPTDPSARWRLEDDNLRSFSGCRRSLGHALIMPNSGPKATLARSRTRWCFTSRARG